MMYEGKNECPAAPGPPGMPRKQSLAGVGLDESKPHVILCSSPQFSSLSKRRGIPSFRLGAAAEAPRRTSSERDRPGGSFTVALVRATSSRADFREELEAKESPKA